MKASPPRPRLAIRVGVTGHRPNKLREADLPALRHRVAALLRSVQGAARTVAEDRAKVYRNEPPLYRIVSALAEGADRLVAEVALDVGFELHAVLPYSAQLHAPELAGLASSAELSRLLGRASAVLVLGGEPRSPTAYEAVGQTMLRHSDLLVAIWDGQEAAGKGGTAEVVQRAVEQNVLTVRIDPRPPHQATLLQDGETDGRAEVGLDQLGPRIVDILTPPPARVTRRGAPLDDLRETYFGEKALRGWLGHSYEIVVNLLTRPTRIWPSLLPRDYVEDSRTAWRTLSPLPEGIARQLDTKLLSSFAWADHLAIYYANRYRSAFTWTYLLAPLAVLAALRAYFARSETWVAVELAALLAILGIYTYGKRRLWHERWLDYRSLAERLRHLAYLLPLGRTTPRVRGPALVATGDARMTWVDWCVRAVVREAGVFAATVDTAHLAACTTLLKDREIGNAEVGQIAYHARNAARMHAVHRRSHTMAMALFAGALAACVGHLVRAFWQEHQVLLTQLAVLLPVMGGSLHGFVSQGDFQGNARRSTAIRAGLQALAVRLERAQPPGTPAPGAIATATEELGDLAEEAAQLMAAELIDWRVGFEGKPLTLPA